jgi:hypothetical protein
MILAINYVQMCKYVGVILHHGSVSIVTRIRSEDRCSILGKNREFSVRHCLHRNFGIHPDSYSIRTEPLSLGIKRPGREVDHSPPFCAEVKNTWSYTTFPPIRLHGAVLS